MKAPRTKADGVSGDRNNVYYIAPRWEGFPLRYNKLRGIRAEKNCPCCPCGSVAN